MSRPPLARVVPPPGRLGSVEILRRVLRNPIEAWPQPVYEDPVYRSKLFGRETVFLTDPDLIREVLVDSAEAFGKAESMRRALRPALGDAILTADGAHWRWQRRAAAPIFRHERILSFVPAMLEAANRAADRLLAAPGRVDLAHEMMRTTFDVIVETMLSQREAIDVGRVERGVTDYLESTSWLVAYALLGAPGWLPYPGKRRAEAARDELRAELLALAAARRREGGGRRDLLALLLDTEDPESGHAMSDRDLADNLLTFITAGHETTALALTWTVYLLARRPEAEARILAEIERVAGDGPLTPDAIDRLVYTRQVIQESMRLYPPAPVVVRRANRAITVGAERIEEGGAVYIPVYAVHRHRRLWEDPDAFDPERFHPEAARGRHRFAYLPFGAGPRICIGMSFALLEAVAILATLLRRVRLAVPAEYEPRLKLRITLRPADGMPVEATPRAGQASGSARERPSTSIAT